MKNGLLIRLNCASQKPVSEVTQIGWPCYDGGAEHREGRIGTTGPLVQSLIFYQPENRALVQKLPVARPGANDNKLAAFRTAKGLCADTLVTRRQPGATIDTCVLAQCIYDSYPAPLASSLQWPPKLQAVAVFPDSRLSEDGRYKKAFGLATIDGHMFDDIIAVPIIDLNGPPLQLRVVAFVPK